MKKAIELDYFNTEAHFGLANAYFKQGNRQEGEREMQIFRKQREGNIAELERSVALVPDNPQFHFELAVQYSRQGRDISAINEYKLAIALDPANAEYHRRLGDAYLKTGTVPRSG